jgi:hypothetical protein
MRIHSESESCSNLDRVLVLIDPPARRAAYTRPPLCWGSRSPRKRWSGLGRRLWWTQRRPR